MAEKKYLDITGLGQYDAKIKALIDSKDAATLTSAKEYANGLAGNYDEKGAAAQALTDAKAYTDTEIGKVNTTVAGVKTTAEQGVTDAATAQGAADAAQADVDALAELVGELPAGAGVETVVAYVDKKTSGIATSDALTTLAGRVTTVEGEIDAIQADYLKAADKTELSNAIAGEKSRAEGVEAGLDERLVEVEAFFKLAEGESLDTALDTLVEIQTYLDSEGAAADQMVKDIAANAQAIADEKTRAEKAEGELKTAYEDADKAIIERLVAVETELGDGEGSVADQIADAVAAEKALREAADATLEGKITTAQNAADKAQGEVDDLEGVVATLTTTVNGKASQADHEALAGRVTTAEGKITTLEGKAHTHANATVLDGITAALVADWNDAVAKEHEHGNKAVLDGITSTLIDNWNAAEANAKAYTDEKIGEFKAITTAEVDSLFQ